MQLRLYRRGPLCIQLKALIGGWLDEHQAWY